MKNKFLIITILITSVPIILHSKSPGTTSAEFLNLSVGVRASGMGETFVGLANDSTAIFWNPAGLSLVTWKELLATYNSWLEGISVSNLSCSIPASRAGTLGFGITYLNSGSITKREETKDDIGDYDMKDIGFTAGYGAEFSRNVSLGFSFKYISEKIEDESGSGFAGDLGFLYFTEIDEYPFNFGISILNLGGKMGPGEKSNLPTKIKAGASIKFLEDRLIPLVEVDYPFKSALTAGLGFEYMVSEIFTLRLGYKFLRDNLSGIQPVTFGFGIAYSQRQDFLFDYAFSNVGDLGMSNKVSVGVRF